jgi:hypothetical protein
LYFGSKKDKNAAFTSFTSGSSNVPYFSAAMSEALGLTHSNPAVIPSVSVGSVINLNNGEGGYQAMSRDFYANILAKPYILLPLIQGQPPFNQSSAVVGFVALKITGISKDKGVASMSGIIVKPAVLGRSGDPPTGAYSPALRNSFSIDSAAYPLESLPACANCSRYIEEWEKQWTKSQPQNARN